MKEHQYYWEQDGFVWNREELTRFFLPENTHTRACWSDEMDEAVAKALLGAEKRTSTSAHCSIKHRRKTRNNIWKISDVNLRESITGIQ
jgi:hypothetical protein